MEQKQMTINQKIKQLRDLKEGPIGALSSERLDQMLNQGKKVQEKLKESELEIQELVQSYIKNGEEAMEL